MASLKTTLSSKKCYIAKGYEFTSQTDTEVVAHLIHDIYEQTNDLLEAVRAVIPKLHGAFALASFTWTHQMSWSRYV